MQPVRQLHDDDPRVPGHRHQQLAEVLRLLLGARAELDASQFRQPVDDRCDLVAELLADLLDPDIGVLDHIVEESRGDRGGVQIERGQDLAHLDAVGDIVLARLALLPLVGPLAVVEGLAQQVEIQAYPGLLDRLQKIRRQ